MWFTEGFQNEVFIKKNEMAASGLSCGKDRSVADEINLCQP